MSQAELRNAGYKVVQIAAIAKGFDQVRSQALVDHYAAQVKSHAVLTGTLVNLIALAAIEIA